MKLRRNLYGLLITLFLFFILVSGCLQEKVGFNETIVPKISKEDAVKIALNDSRVIAKIDNHTFNVSENDVSSAILDNKEVYLVKVNLYNGKLFGTINVFITYDGQVTVIGWEYPAIIPTPPSN
ncbi:MAG: hypothetical protein O8C63_12520 [Candidatus Methanoperedens sp.]|nr:hypothetical protein [Candidatus Methanoperedens sp.]